MPIVAAFAAVFLGAFLFKAGGAAGRALWLPVVLVALGFMAFALWLWHRRQMAALHGLRLEYLTHWEQVSKFQPWPKFCGRCAQRAWSWKEAGLHDDQETSPCARLAHYQEQLETPADSLPMDGFRAEVLEQDQPRQTDREAIERV